MLRLLPACVAALGLWMLFHEMFASGLALYPSDPADPRYVQFQFEHSWAWLRGATSAGLFDLPMAYPVPNMLAHSEPMLSFAPFYWLFRVIGLSASTSHQLWTVLMAALNFACFYALMRRALRFDRVAASASAFLFAFGLPRVAQIGHSQLWPQIYIVLVLWGLHALLSESSSARARSWGGPAVIVGLVLQAWGCLYNAVFVAYMCVVIGLFALLEPDWRERALRALRDTRPAGIACMLLALACLWPLAQAYLPIAGTTPDWDPIEARLLQPRLGSLVYVWPLSWFYGWMTTATPLGQLPAVHEQALGLGLLTTGVVLYTLVSQRRRKVVLLVALLVLVLLAPAIMWPGEHTLWWQLHAQLPGLSALRSTSRIGLLLLIPASVALGLCAQRRSESRWPALWIAVVVLCLVEQGTSTRSFSKQPYELVVDRIAGQVDPQAEAFFYVATGRVPHWYSQVDAILAAQQAGVPTLNSYAARLPEGYQRLLHPHVADRPKKLRRVLTMLDQWIEMHDLDAERVQLIIEDESWMSPSRGQGDRYRKSRVTEGAREVRAPESVKSR